MSWFSGEELSQSLADFSFWGKRKLSSLGEHVAREQRQGCPRARRFPSGPTAQLLSLLAKNCFVQTGAHAPGSLETYLNQQGVTLPRPNTLKLWSNLLVLKGPLAIVTPPCGLICKSPAGASKNQI